jgi:Uma2 family endonuclease
MTQVLEWHNQFDAQPAASALPPLQSGDHLSRQEFERRYAAMPQARAELINGVVFMASPVHLPHARYHAYVMAWLGTYRALHPETEVYDNVSLRLDETNEVQPDAVLVLVPAQGGSSSTSQDMYLEGAPELIVEIAASSAAYDLYEKKTIYQQAGVQEYIIWQVYEQQLTWLSLQDDGVYAEVSPDEDGIVRSRTFAGLHLDVNALLCGNLARVLEVVQAGGGNGEGRMTGRGRATWDSG